MADLILRTSDLTRSLNEFEGDIERGITSFVDMAFALQAIHDRKLYIEAGYNSFSAYCEGRWGFSIQHAYRLIEAADIANVVSNSPTGESSETLSINERQARELIPLRNHPDVMRDAWQTATETAPNGKVTANHVRAVVDEILDRSQQQAEDKAALKEMADTMPAAFHAPDAGKWTSTLYGFFRALNMLASMPSAAEVVAHIQVWEVGQVQPLPAARVWLEDFAESWREAHGE